MAGGSYQNQNTNASNTVTLPKMSNQQEEVFGRLGVYYSTGARTIAYDMGIPEPSVRRTLSELKARGLVKKTPNGYTRA